MGRWKSTPKARTVAKDYERSGSPDFRRRAADARRWRSFSASPPAKSSSKWNLYRCRHRRMDRHSPPCTQLASERTRYNKTKTKTNPFDQHRQHGVVVVDDDDDEKP